MRRPTLRGYGGAVTAGHYLASQAGAELLAAGGNAADAACAMGFALQVLEPHMNGPAGEVPILYYDAHNDRTLVISGQGPAPGAASIERMQELGVDRIPADGLLGITVPAALDAWCLLLEHFGTCTLEEVLQPAWRLASRGFPMYPFLRNLLQILESKFRDTWPSTGEVYLPLRANGERQTNPALAAFLEKLGARERHCSGTREQKIRAARDWFYQEEPAEIIERFVQMPLLDGTGRENKGLLNAADLAAYSGSIEEPIRASYRGTEVWKCPAWSQGPVFLQQLRLLEGFDLAAMGGGSADALHTWIEAAKLAFADREACYGDPAFVDVPLEQLLSAPYTELRCTLIDAEKASMELRPGLGRLPEGWPLIFDTGDPPFEPQAFASAKGRSDTTHLDAADRFGNLVSATPSGAWIPTSPVIPELGFPLGTRAQMFVLDPQHPNALAPGKRPRTTLTPSIALHADGRRMAFGTPGGDQQDQWTNQFFLNLIDFGYDDLQAAIDAPTVHSMHMPSSFYPRTCQPGVVAIESRMDRDVVTELAARGHRVHTSGPWEHGRVMAIRTTPDGAIEAAASPRSGGADPSAPPKPNQHTRTGTKP